MTGAIVELNPKLMRKVTANPVKREKIYIPLILQVDINRGKSNICSS